METDPSGATPAPDANKQDQNPQPQPGASAPTQLAPQAPAPTPEAGASAHIDLAKILLPKKEIHTAASAERINAGALLEQETTAGTEGIPAEQKAAETTPLAPIPTPAQSASAVKALETFQGDIAELVERKNVSAVSIASAEAKRRDAEGHESAEEGTGLGSKILFFFIGALLVAGASGLVAYVFLLPKTASIQTAPQTPFIVVDATSLVTLQPEDATQSAIMRALTQAKENARLSLGLVGRLYPVTPASTMSAYPQPVSAPALFGILAPELPPEFLRALQPTFLLGVYSYAGMQPFLILKTDSYEQAYSGMLVWEGTMQKDLAPLFTYEPRPRIPEEALPATASTTAATTTPQTILPAAFADRVVENHDARAIQNDQGDIVLLWTFLDRSTIVITTSDAALREVIGRLKDASVIPLVGK